MTVRSERTYHGKQGEVTFERKLKDFAGDARVEYGAGVTENLGDYNSARVYVCVTLPCEPGEVTLALAKAKAIVTKQVEIELEEVRT